jgi:hypothetical protein
MAIIQKSEKKSKGVADIVFCIDHSGSMSSCIEGVKEHVNSFVKTLDGLNANTIIDWQIGLCAYTNRSIHFLPLTKATNRFRDVLSKGVEGWDEFTPGAIDYAVTTSKWRDVSHRIIVNFTDEPLRGGSSPNHSDSGAGLFDELLKKIQAAKIQLYYFGKECPYYDKFNVLPKAQHKIMNNFNSVDFSQLMTNLALTVSESSKGQQEKTSIPGLIYNFSGIKITSY